MLFCVFPHIIQSDSHTEEIYKMISFLFIMWTHCWGKGLDNSRFKTVLYVFVYTLKKSFQRMSFMVTVPKFTDLPKISQGYAFQLGISNILTKKERLNTENFWVLEWFTFLFSKAQDKKKINLKGVLSKKMVIERKSY